MAVRPKILYINSYTRSGSTLLGMLLGTQPTVTYLGEVRRFSEHLLGNKTCFCGSMLDKCEFWRPIVKGVIKEGTRFETKSMGGLWHNMVKYLSIMNIQLRLGKCLGIRSKVLDKELEVIDNISRLYELVSSVHGSITICDSSKSVTLAKRLWMKYRGEFKVIHLIRNGMGVSNSVMKRKGRSIDMVAKDWKRSNIFSLIVQYGIRREDIIRVRYEDICSNPKKEVRKICEFAGIDFFQDRLHLNRNAFHFIGGSSTLRRGRNTYIPINFDESWKNELAERDKRMFGRIAGSINRLYGYK